MTATKMNFDEKWAILQATKAAFDDFYVPDDVFERAKKIVDEVDKIGQHSAIEKYDGLAVLIAEGILRQRERIARKVNQTQEIGSFRVKSGKLMVSDPCYSGGDLELKNVKTGTWKAHVVFREGWGVRPFGLMAVHCDTYPRTIPISAKDLKDWEELKTIGVDSGQAGIYDLPIFRTGPDKDHDNADAEAWYEENGKHTLGDLGCGVIEGGCVSRSGYGDGGYMVYGHAVRNKIVAVWIDFFGVKREDEDEDDE